VIATIVVDRRRESQVVGTCTGWNRAGTTTALRLLLLSLVLGDKLGLQLLCLKGLEPEDLHLHHLHLESLLLLRGGDTRAERVLINGSSLGWILLVGKSGTIDGRCHRSLRHTV
jgi:hypothetical protein